MEKIDSLRVAICNVDLSRELNEFAQEFAFHWKELPREESKLRTEIKRYKPDVIITNNEMVPSVYALVDAGNRPAIFVTTNEDSPNLPNSLAAGVADEAIILPLRRLAFINSLRWVKHLAAIRQFEGMGTSVEKLVNRLEQDFALAQKIQRRLIKDRFPNVSGLNIKSKYWCGTRGGGDYFDVFEFGDNRHVGFLLGDVSSYALSSRLLSSLMMFSVKKNFDEFLDPVSFVRKTFVGIQEKMKDSDSFSCFYGILDRRSFTLRYVSYGSISVALQSGSGPTRWVQDGESSPLSLQNSELSADDLKELSLEPEDRISIFSDGFTEGTGKQLQSFYEKLKREDPQKIINELSYALKSQQDPEGEAALAGELIMPPQDCSVLLIEVAKNVLRLAQ